MLDDFLSLSTVLTGERTLPRDVGARHLERIAAGSFGSALPRLLKQYRALVEAGGDLEDGVRTGIFGDPDLAKLAQEMTLLWYVGGLPGVDGKTWSFASPDDYFQGLVWPVIEGHPPGLSGGYFGHWRYPAER